METLLRLFPGPLRDVLGRLPPHARESLEEIRVRESRPLEIGYDGRFGFVTEDGVVTQDASSAYMPGAEQCRGLLERITNHSVYAVEEELKRGFVTVKGGHRIGLAGRTVLEAGAVSHLRDIAGFNVRIARARPGCAAGVLPALLDKEAGTVRHTLVVSPPLQGKTTLLRELARSISAGQWFHPAAASWGGKKVGIVDERSEIAACEKGVPTFDLGPRTDVLDGCPKAEGIMMMVRSLSPEVIVADEIGRPEDAYALQDAVHAGVRVVASAHAADLQDVFARPVIAGLAEDGVFGAYVLLSRKGGRVEQRVVTGEEARHAFGSRLHRFATGVGAARDAPSTDRPLPPIRSPNGQPERGGTGYG